MAVYGTVHILEPEPRVSVEQDADSTYRLVIRSRDLTGRAAITLHRATDSERRAFADALRAAADKIGG